MSKSLSVIKSFRNDTGLVTKPKPKPKRKSQNYKGYEELRPSIKPGLTLIFIGFNPGLESSKQQHHYAHHTNLFWKLFNESQILAKSLKFYDIKYDNDDLLKEIMMKAKPCHDFQLVNYNIGFTDLVLRCTRTAQELSFQEKLDNIPRLIKEFQYATPQKIVVIGKGIWEVFIKYIYTEPREYKRVMKNFQWGLQEKMLSQPFSPHEIYVFPSTSGLVTTLTYAQRLDLWNQLFPDLIKP